MDGCLGVCECNDIFIMLHLTLTVNIEYIQNDTFVCLPNCVDFLAASMLSVATTLSITIMIVFVFRWS